MIHSGVPKGKWRGKTKVQQAKLLGTLAPMFDGWSRGKMNIYQTTQFEQTEKVMKFQLGTEGWEKQPIEAWTLWARLNLARSPTIPPIPAQLTKYYNGKEFQGIESLNIKILNE